MVITLTATLAVSLLAASVATASDPVPVAPGVDEAPIGEPQEPGPDVRLPGEEALHRSRAAVGENNMSDAVREFLNEVGRAQAAVGENTLGDAVQAYQAALHRSRAAVGENNMSDAVREFLNEVQAAR